MSDSGILSFEVDSIGTMEQTEIQISAGINDIITGRFSKSTLTPEPLFRAYGFPRSISPQRELQNLSDEIRNALKYFSENAFIEVVRNLTTSNLEIRNLALSGNLPEDVSDTLDNLSYSLDSCIEIIYKKLRESEPLEGKEEKKIRSFLEGVPTLLMYFSNLK